MHHDALPPPTQVASTNAPGLDFFSLVAYGINFRNVTLAAPETVQPPVPALTARPPTAPLYDLGLPASTTAIGIWSQQDLLLALQGVQVRPAVPGWHNSAGWDAGRRRPAGRCAFIVHMPGFRA